MRNGSALDGDGSTSQLLEPQQHCEHSLELAVEMDLVASKPLQLVRIERLAECLLAIGQTFLGSIFVSLDAGGTSAFGLDGLNVLPIRVQPLDVKRPMA